MQILQQVNVAMPNVPSSLAKVGDRLRAEELNIEAIASSENPPVIHLIVDDPETAKLVLKDLGSVTITPVIAFEVKNKPGVIANIGRACAAMGINIRLIYATTFRNDAMVYIAVENAEAALEALKTWEKSAGKLS